MLTLFLAACRAGVQEPDPARHAPEFPERFSTTQADATADIGWCDDYGDPLLLPVLNEVLENNLDLRAAGMRIAEADALIRQARAGLFPVVDVQAQVSRGSTRVQTPAGGQAITATQYGLSAPLQWEVDLWGRIAHQRDAARSDRDALVRELDAQRRSLAGRAAELWYELAAARSTLQRIDTQQEVVRVSLELVVARFSEGQAVALDIVQQRQRLEALQARRAEAEQTLRLLEQALALLQGRAPGQAELGQDTILPAEPPPPVWALPADVLEARPDIEAARLRVEAADYRVRAALAERLPTLVLSANLALQAQRLDELFDFLFWGIAAQAGQRVFDGGRRRARVEGQRAALERVMLEYAAAMLAAIGEVEALLARIAAQAEIARELEAQRESAAMALELAEASWREGMVDYLRVLDAQQSLQDLELRQLELGGAQWTTRVALCRALGAGPSGLSDIGKRE